MLPLVNATERVKEPNDQLVGAERNDEGDNDEGLIKVREYINSAVYVEKTYNKKADRHATYEPSDNGIPLMVKRCVCFTNPGKCVFHVNVHSNGDGNNMTVTKRSSSSDISLLKPQSRKGSSEEQDRDGSCKSNPTLCRKTLSCNLMSNETAINEIPITTWSSGDSNVNMKESSSELRLSIPSLTTMASSQNGSETMRGDNFRQWCIRKDTEKRLRAEREDLIRKIKEQQRQAVLELERENFKRWLTLKKEQEEAELRAQKLREEEKARLRLEERKKRLLESELSYQIWLKQKEEKELERKIKEQMFLINREEEKQRRYEYSQQAYDHWKKLAKDRQKPVPFGLGIDSLKSSASVSYINPEPWVPNIDLKQKPHSK